MWVSVRWREGVREVFRVRLSLSMVIGLGLTMKLRLNVIMRVKRLRPSVIINLNRLRMSNTKEFIIMPMSLSRTNSEFIVKVKVEQINGVTNFMFV